MTRAILISVIRQLREKRDGAEDGRVRWFYAWLIDELVKGLDDE